jgi:hypothetical protein
MPIEHLTPARLDAMKQFSEAVWQRPTSADYYRWRYLDAPGLTTLLATDGDRCVATLSAFSRKYHTGDGIVECLEPFDWYTLPDMKGFGVGAHLMKGLMDTGKPIVSLGGSEDTLRFLPRLGFRQIAAATEFFLPLTGRYIMRSRKLPALARNVASPLLDLAASVVYTPSKPSAAYSFQTLPGTTLGDKLSQIDGPVGFRPAPDQGFLDWLEKGSGTGKYFICTVNKDEETVAWLLCRLYRSGGLLHGAILDLRLKQADGDVAVNALRGAGRMLANCGVDDVRAFTTSPFLATAYAQAGYRAGSEKIPALLWCGKHTLDFDSIALSSGPDEAFWPLETKSLAAASATGASAPASMMQNIEEYP